MGVAVDFDSWTQRGFITTMADTQKQQSATLDSFNVVDRRELIRVGLQLDELIRQNTEARTTTLAAIAAHEMRLNSLETTRIEQRAQVKAYAALGTLAAGFIGWGLHLGVDWLLKH